MKEWEAFRDKATVKGLAKAIGDRMTTSHVIMEMCGGQTNSIARYQLEKILPPDLELVHGPGCPVCVTPQTVIDQAVALASRPEVIFTSFGDMMRVPGKKDSLMSMKSRGADVRIVYSPLDALGIARQNPDREVVFFAIGFETTAPVHALALREAQRLGVSNFSLLTSLVTVPAAVSALMEDPDNRVEGLLAAGHVCAVTGYEEYHALARKYSLPVCITGFEPVDLLWGIYNCIDQLESGEHTVRNNYSRMVQACGNAAAISVINDVFEPFDQEWRGLGIIPQSGLRIREKYEPYDASVRFKIIKESESYESECRAADIMKGKIHPCKCPAFGIRCTPENPLGASMVSSEGACAAYFKYNKYERDTMSAAI